MYKIFAVLLCVSCISWASSQKPDKTNEINPKSQKIDPVLRRALLKAITELENEQTDLPELLDSTTENAVNSDDFQEENESLETSDISHKNEVDQSENDITLTVNDSKLNSSEAHEAPVSFRSYSVDGQKALDNEEILESKEVTEIGLEKEAELILSTLKLEKSQSKNIKRDQINNDDSVYLLSESRNIDEDTEQEEIEEELLPNLKLKNDDLSLPTEHRNYDEDIEEEEETIEGTLLPAKKLTTPLSKNIIKSVDSDDSSELLCDLNLTHEETKEEEISQTKTPSKIQNRILIQKTSTERAVIKRKKTTTEKPILTTKPSHNSDGENIETLENVQVFQAPLVAAFTVHQDINGSPKMVIPIYKQAQRRPLDQAVALNTKVKNSSPSVQETNIGLQSLQRSNFVNRQLNSDVNPLVPSFDLSQQQYRPYQQNFEIPSPILQEPRINIQSSAHSNYGKQLIESANPLDISKEQQYQQFQHQLEQKTRLLEEKLIELQKQQKYHEEILKQQQMLHLQIEQQIQPKNQPGGQQLNSFRVQHQPINNAVSQQNLEPVKQQVVQNEQQTIQQIQLPEPQLNPLRVQLRPIQQAIPQQNFVTVQPQPIQSQQNFVPQQQPAQPQQNFVQQQKPTQPQQNFVQQQQPTQTQQNFVQQSAQPQHNFVQQQQPAQPQHNFVQQQQPAQPQQNFVQQQQPAQPQQNFVQQQQHLQQIIPQQSTQQAAPQQNLVRVQQQQLQQVTPLQNLGQEQQRPVQQVIPQQSVLPPSSFSIQPSISAHAIPPNIDLQLPEKEAVDFLNYLRIYPNQQPAPSFNQLHSQVPTLSLLPPHSQQQLPIYAPYQNNFNVPLKQNILQQQLPAEKSYQNTFTSSVQQNLHQQQLPKEKSFVNFNNPIQQNPSLNRVFRHDSGTGNLGFNTNNGFNYVNYYPTNNNRNFAQQQSRFMSDKLQSLLHQSGLTSGGKSQEDLNIVTKVLSLNHGFPLGQQYFN